MSTPQDTIAFEIAMRSGFLYYSVGKYKKALEAYNRAFDLIQQMSYEVSSNTRGQWLQCVIGKGDCLIELNRFSEAARKVEFSYIIVFGAAPKAKSVYEFHK